MFWGFCVGVVLASWDFVVFCVGNNSDDGITSSRLTCSRVTPDECKLVWPLLLVYRALRPLRQDTVIVIAIDALDRFIDLSDFHENNQVRLWFKPQKPWATLLVYTVTEVGILLLNPFHLAVFTTLDTKSPFTPETIMFMNEPHHCSVSHLVPFSGVSTTS